MEKEYVVKNNNIEEIDASKFVFVQKEKHLSDHKMETKRIGYFKDAFLRFCRNKASVVAACIICFLFLFAIFVPILFDSTYNQIENDNSKIYYEKLLPKVFDNTGFWDGTEKLEGIGTTRYNRLRAIAVETGRSPIQELIREYKVNGKTVYDIRLNSYYNLGVHYETFTKDEYLAIQKYQDENNIQILYPVMSSVSAKEDEWYQVGKDKKPVFDSEGNFIDNYRKGGIGDIYTSKMRIEGDDGTYNYSWPSGKSSYLCRIDHYTYFIYKYGEEPSFIFGTDTKGFDIFTRLAKGARLSFILAFFVAIINLVIGAIYGSIAGYFGGTTDLVMERITDILGNVPFMVVTTLFQLHLAKHVGPIVSLLFAFVSTGWIGTASTVRMQFYRYKNQEYILAARTLGAKHSRLMFKHIFPNALGTIITSSVLVIPGVIFSESSLTYLGIVNLESEAITSVGTMLANGKSALDTTPHIILFPALFISLLMITFNLFGNGLRDAFNPSLRGSED